MKSKVPTLLALTSALAGGSPLPTPYVRTSGAAERAARIEKTPADLAAMAKAEAKRARKAAKLSSKGL